MQSDISTHILYSGRSTDRLLETSAVRELQPRDGRKTIDDSPQMDSQ